MKLYPKGPETSRYAEVASLVEKALIGDDVEALSPALICPYFMAAKGSFERLLPTIRTSVGYCGPKIVHRWRLGGLESNITESE